MIKIKKEEIVKKHCYTKLVYERINKKLKTNFSTDESQILIKKILEETTLENYIKKGKNFYISNKQHAIRVTVNSNTFRVITVDRITNKLR
ncbi:DUF3781 domain-containing protein [Polaribacter atrinae]|uniref:DUF3781 domain-containing protein n=1 Tax=Polaribacter atrinae TaxID=1333662 RepID=A0A176TC52_9FLAO|nr:DUF3781 domain-containing protein [Polaribacter atrinae]OAD45339.1 hypothetical protein LPB303_08065 [Polaribacter atrinae]